MRRPARRSIVAVLGSLLVCCGDGCKVRDGVRADDAQPTQVAPFPGPDDIVCIDEHGNQEEQGAIGRAVGLAGHAHSHRLPPRSPLVCDEPLFRSFLEMHRSWRDCIDRDLEVGVIFDEAGDLFCVGLLWPDNLPLAALQCLASRLRDYRASGLTVIRISVDQEGAHRGDCESGTR